MDAPGQVSEAHWNEEAKAILGGLIMFCVCREEKNRRALATVREYLTLPPERLRALLELMQDSDAANGLVAPRRQPVSRQGGPGSGLGPVERATPHPLSGQPAASPEFCRGRISTSRSCACWSSQALNDIARDAEDSSSGLQHPKRPHRAPERLRTPRLGPLPSSCWMNSLLWAVWRPWNAPWGLWRAMGFSSGRFCRTWAISRTGYRTRRLRARVIRQCIGVQHPLWA